MELDESKFTCDDFIVINRLMIAYDTPELRHVMEVENEILSEIEDRNTTIMMKDKEINRKT